MKNIIAPLFVAALLLGLSGCGKSQPTKEQLVAAALNELSADAAKEFSKHMDIAVASAEYVPGGEPGDLSGKITYRLTLKEDYYEADEKGTDKLKRELSEVRAKGNDLIAADFEGGKTPQVVVPKLLYLKTKKGAHMDMFAKINAEKRGDVYKITFRGKPEPVSETQKDPGAPLAAFGHKEGEYAIHGTKESEQVLVEYRASLEKLEAVILEANIKADERRRVEAERREAARRAEAERREAERKAEAERWEAARRAERAEAERRETARKAEGERQEAARRAEAERQEAARRAEEERLAKIAQKQKEIFASRFQPGTVYEGTILCPNGVHKNVEHLSKVIVTCDSYIGGDEYYVLGTLNILADQNVHVPIRAQIKVKGEMSEGTIRLTVVVGNEIDKKYCLTNWGADRRFRNVIYSMENFTWQMETEHYSPDVIKLKKATADAAEAIIGKQKKELEAFAKAVAENFKPGTVYEGTWNPFGPQKHKFTYTCESYEADDENYVLGTLKASDGSAIPLKFVREVKGHTVLLKGYFGKPTGRSRSACFSMSANGWLFSQENCITYSHTEGAVRADVRGIFHFAMHVKK